MSNHLCAKILVIRIGGISPQCMTLSVPEGRNALWSHSSNERLTCVESFFKNANLTLPLGKAVPFLGERHGGEC